MKKYIKCGNANERDKRVEYIIDTLNYLTRYGSGVSQDEKQADKLVEKMYNIASDIESLLHSAKSSTRLDGRNITASEDYYEDPLIIAKEYFETGHGPDEFEEEYFKDEDAYEEYLEYINLGPRGFYEEYKDELDFDDFFVEEYGQEDKIDKFRK